MSDADTQLFTCPGPKPPCKNNSHPTISSDGDLVVFDSDAADIVPNFPNTEHSTQIYLRDVAHDKTILISAAQQPNGDVTVPDSSSSFGDISPDGKWVAFSSTASNLVPTDGDRQSDLYLVRVTPFSITRLSMNPGGQLWDGDSHDAFLSFDANLVVFASLAKNFADLRLPGGKAPSPERPRQFDQVFVLDRSSGAVEWLSISPALSTPNGESTQPGIDENGLRVCFTSDATDLGFQDPNGDDLDVFVRDRTNGQLSCASLAANGQTTGNGTSRKSALSGDGRYVVFESTASDLLPDHQDSNNVQDVFVRDLDSGVLVCVSVSTTGGPANGQSGYGALSSTGRFVAFTSFARNLVPNDTTRGFSDFFVRDRDVSGSGVFDQPGNVLTRRLSVSAAGIQANARSGGNCDLSADGRYVVFMSEADTLVPGDTNGVVADQACSPTCLSGRDVFRSLVFP